MGVDVAARVHMVGELACQRDSYLQELDTIVVACTQLQPQLQNGSGTKAKTTKKSKAESESSVAPKLWQIEFADSILFPEGTWSFSARG
jgi:misacylated tRNA(Ala) deacylase